MLESFAGILPLLIPILALLIGLVVMGGIFIVQPLVKAITRLADSQTATAGALQEPEARQIEQRLTHLEGMLERLLEQREFERTLHAGDSPAAMYPRPSRHVRGDTGRAPSE